MLEFKNTETLTGDVVVGMLSVTVFSTPTEVLPTLGGVNLFGSDSLYFCQVHFPDIYIFRVTFCVVCCESLIFFQRLGAS